MSINPSDLFKYVVKMKYLQALIHSLCQAAANGSGDYTHSYGKPLPAAQMTHFVNMGISLHKQLVHVSLTSHS